MSMTSSLLARAYSVRMFSPQIKLGPSLFVPNGQIGSFGALSRIRSLIASRADLFDLSASGPAAAGLASAVLFAVGLSFTGSMPKAKPVPLLCALVISQLWARF